MSDLTPLLTTSGSTGGSSYFAHIFPIYGDNNGTYSSSVDPYFICITKVTEGEEEEFVFGANLSEYLATQHNIGNSGGANSTGENGANFYCQGIYRGKGYKIYTDSTKTQETAFSDKNLMLILSYDGDSFFILDVNDPTSPVPAHTFPSSTIPTSKSFQVSGSRLNQGYATSWLTKSPLTPDGNIHAYGPNVIGREGSSGGGYLTSWFGANLVTGSSTPTMNREDIQSSTLYSRTRNGVNLDPIWIDNSMPLVSTFHTTSDTLSVFACDENTFSDAYIDGYNGDAKYLDGLGARVSFPILGDGIHNMAIVNHEDCNYTYNGNDMHLALMVGFAATNYWLGVPATGVTKANHASSQYETSLGQTMLAYQDWANIPIINNTIATDGSLSSLDHVSVYFEPNVKADPSSFGTAIFLIVLNSTHPTTNREEFFLMTADIRAPSNNLNTTYSATTTNTPIHDIIDFKVVTNDLYGGSDTNGGWTGTGSSVDNNSNFVLSGTQRLNYCQVNRHMLVAGTWSNGASADLNSSYNYPTGYRFYTLKEDGTISDPHPQAQGGWAKLLLENVTFSQSSAWQPRYFRGGSGIGSDSFWPVD